MKKFLILVVCLAVFTASCSNDFGEYASPNWYKIVLCGFVIGCVLGLLYAKAPEFDFTKPVSNLKKIIPCVLVWGIILAGMAFLFCKIYGF